LSKAITDMRFGTAMVMQNAAEFIAYGTGVVVDRKIKNSVIKGRGGFNSPPLFFIMP